MLDTVPATALDRYGKDGGVLIIDLRSEKDYREGHIQGAVSVPQGEFQGRWPDPKKTLLLYCDRGSLSMAVGRDLSRRGYWVKSVVGGFAAYRGKRLVRGG